MLEIICLIGLSGHLWHRLLEWLYTREVSRLGPRDYADSASASVGTLVQVLVLGFSGLWFMSTHERALDVAPGPVLTVILCATLGKWLVDVAYMVRSGKPNAYDLLHHGIATVMIGYVLWTQTTAWYFAVAVFFAELPGMGYFSTQAFVRLRIDAPRALLALRCGHFVIAASVWIVAVPILTFWYARACAYDPLTTAICIGYNAFTGWSAYKLVTRTPKTLRAMARELESTN